MGATLTTIKASTKVGRIAQLKVTLRYVHWLSVIVHTKTMVGMNQVYMLSIATEVWHTVCHMYLERLKQP